MVPCPANASTNSNYFLLLLGSIRYGRGGTLRFRLRPSSSETGIVFYSLKFTPDTRKNHQQPKFCIALQKFCLSIPMKLLTLVGTKPMVKTLI